MFPDWVRQKEFGIHTRAMEVNNGFVHWSAGAEVADCAR